MDKILGQKYNFVSREAPFDRIFNLYRHTFQQGKYELCEEFNERLEVKPTFSNKKLILNTKIDVKPFAKLAGKNFDTFHETIKLLITITWIINSSYLC